MKVKKPSVKVTPKKVSLKVGKEKTLTCKFTPESGRYYVRCIQYDELIDLKLHNDGKIVLKGLKKGSCTLTITLGACKKSVKVTVK